MIFVTWWTFQTCCSLLGMLGIFGEVGRPNSMKPLPGPKFLKFKVFENNFFRSLLRLFWDQNIRDRYRDFFRDQIFARPIPRLFFETKYFWDRYRDFFSRQIFLRPIPRLFFETKYFRDQYRDFFSRPKFSRPRPVLSKNWEKSRYREVSRRDVTLWSSLTTRTFYHSVFCHFLYYSFCLFVISSFSLSVFLTLGFYILLYFCHSVFLYLCLWSS